MRTKCLKTERERTKSASSNPWSRREELRCGAGGWLCEPANFECETRACFSVEHRRKYLSGSVHTPLAAHFRDDRLVTPVRTRKNEVTPDACHDESPRDIFNTTWRGPVFRVGGHTQNIARLSARHGSLAYEIGHNVSSRPFPACS